MKSLFYIALTVFFASCAQNRKEEPGPYGPVTTKHGKTLPGNALDDILSDIRKIDGHGSKNRADYRVHVSHFVSADDCPLFQDPGNVYSKFRSNVRSGIFVVKFVPVDHLQLGGDFTAILNDVDLSKVTMIGGV